MKQAIGLFLGVLIGIGILIFIGLIVGTEAGAQKTSPQHAVCLQSRREVVMIPTICGEHDICQKPIVTDVCERIESPPPRPLCQGGE